MTNSLPSSPQEEAMKIIRSQQIENMKMAMHPIVTVESLSPQEDTRASSAFDVPTPAVREALEDSVGPSLEKWEVQFDREFDFSEEYKKTLPETLPTNDVGMLIIEIKSFIHNLIAKTRAEYPLGTTRRIIMQTEDRVREEEKQAWLDGKRCLNCGKEKIPDLLCEICSECLENN